MQTSDAVSPVNASQLAADAVDAKSQVVSLSGDDGKQGTGPDVFESRGPVNSSVGREENGDEGFVLSQSLQDPSEELPIELISLMDR